ncbi:ABC transporter substrate-binding protein [Plantibacter sp. YIM 135347]|uniref:ABC transporter substrate-binding protein n=1 Tax=Plantibacter sp. YIM 135347 TaxID=3423919 RepID=UPI003D328D5C
MPFTPSGRRARRVTLSLVGFLGAAVLVAGCSSGGSGGGAPSGEYTPADKDLKAEITYGLWDQAQVAAIDANIKQFNKEYPNITVNVNVTPWASYWSKLQTQASSDTLPDLFWLNGPNFQIYASNGKVEPITGEVKADAIDPKNYPSALNDLYSLDGVQYGVPKDFDTIGVWINTALFDQAGVALPADGWTWKDFETAAQTISTNLKDQGIYGAAGGMDGQTTYYNTILQAGGEVINADQTKSGYDSPESQEGLQFWTDLIANGSSPSMQQLTDTPADQWFTSGKLAMYWGGSWVRPLVGESPVADTTKAVPLPIGKEQATVIHGVSNVVASASKNKQAAQALQVFLASKKAQQEQGDLGAIIPAYTGTQQSFVDSYPNMNLQVFLDALDYAKPLPVSKDTAAWNALETELLPDAFSGDKPVKDVAKDLADQMNAVLAK